MSGLFWRTLRRLGPVGGGQTIAKANLDPYNWLAQIFYDRQAGESVAGGHLPSALKL